MEIAKELLKPFIWVLKIVIFCILIAILAAFLVGDVKRPNLAQISLVGEIIDERAFLEKIYKIRDDDEIKGVLLYIDSPGGAVAPSFEISSAIKNLKSKKPVIAYVSGTMASGSYLGGMWANEIYANRGSIIGSIGVIIQGFNIESLASKIGVSDQVVKAGEYKEAGTVMRTWTPKERESLQHLVDESYETFVNEVALARGLDANKSGEWANARVFSAKEASAIGLIDGISDYENAMKMVENAAKVGDPVWQKPNKYEQFMDDFSSQTAAKILSFFELKLR